MTFSIVARCTQTQMFGVAIASSSPAVAARCAHARAHVGAATTQNITDPALGPQLLEFLARGQQADLAVEHALADTEFGAFRQLAVVGKHGPPAVHSGRHVLGLAASAIGLHAAAAGNLLARAEVPAAMVGAFDAASGHLGDRLLIALRAGAQCGGEAGPIHSAGLLVVREVSWPIVDLRVDWAEREPLEGLARIWSIYAPQIDDYVRRAVNPAAAPTFGVPGDL